MPTIKRTREEKRRELRMQPILTALRESRQTHVPEMAQMLEAIIKRYGFKQLAIDLVALAKTGNTQEKRTFLKLILDFIRLNSRDRIDLTQNEISRLADEQIDAMLQEDFGFPAVDDEGKAIAERTGPNPAKPGVAEVPESAAGEVPEAAAEGAGVSADDADDGVRADPDAEEVPPEPGA